MQTSNFNSSSVLGSINFNCIPGCVGKKKGAALGFFGGSLGLLRS